MKGWGERSEAGWEEIEVIYRQPLNEDSLQMLVTALMFVSGSRKFREWDFTNDRYDFETDTVTPQPRPEVEAAMDALAKVFREQDRTDAKLALEAIGRVIDEAEGSRMLGGDIELVLRPRNQETVDMEVQMMQDRLDRGEFGPPEVKE
jgi:hypothetical protein